MFVTALQHIPLRQKRPTERNVMTVPTPSRHALLGAAAAFAAVAPDEPFNAPNDGVVHPVDGALWFTDPGYGGLMDYEGNRVPESANPPRPFIKEAGYRLDTSGQLTKVTDAPFKPNGLCFSPDHSKLYVADTGKSHYPEAKNIIGQFDVNGAPLSNRRVFADMTFESKAGFADGYDGVHIFAPNGDRIGLIKLPEICLSVCFGGARRNRLFMTASQSLYSVMVETRGAHFC
jgi:gluconolactonase